MAALPEFITLELHNSLCRKIAELTRVIDRLFRQYYEQSLQLKYLQQQTKPDNAANREGHLENEVKTLQHTLEKLRDELKSKEEHQNQCISDQQSLEQQVQSLLGQNRELEQENHKLLKDLSQARSNMEDMKVKLQHQDENYELCSDQLARIAVLEDQVRHEVAQNSLLAKKNAKLSKELEDLKILRKQKDSESEDERHRMQSLIQQLQDQLKILQLQPSSSPPPAVRVKKQLKPNPVHRVKKEREYWLESLPKTNQCDDEVARLKQEVQRYRLELMNREANFNRVFSSGHGSSHTIMSTVNNTVKENKSLMLPQLNHQPHARFT